MMRFTLYNALCGEFGDPPIETSMYNVREYYRKHSDDDPNRSVLEEVLDILDGGYSDIIKQKYGYGLYKGEKHTNREIVESMMYTYNEETDKWIEEAEAEFIKAVELVSEYKQIVRKVKLYDKTCLSLSKKLHRKPTIEEISEKMGYDIKEINEIIGQKMWLLEKKEF